MFPHTNRCYNSLALLSVLSILLSPSLSYGYVTIYGAVTDSNSQAITNAEVISHGTSSSTDESGNYIISHNNPGTYDVVVSKTGYATQTQTVTADDGEDIELNFALVPAPLKLIRVNPTWEETSKDIDFDIYGDGFSQNTRISMSIDSGNSQTILTSDSLNLVTADVEVVGSAWQKTPIFNKILTCADADNAVGFLSGTISGNYMPLGDNDSQFLPQLRIAPPSTLPLE